MVRKSLFFILTAALAVQTLLLTACQKKDEQAEAAPAMPPTFVTAETAQEGFPETVKKYVGVFEAIDSVDVVARVSGKIMEINFQEGSDVKAGEQLFKIEDDIYKANVAAAQAALANGEANIKSSQANLDAAKASVEDLSAKLTYAVNNYLRNARLYCGESEELNAASKMLVESKLEGEAILAGIQKIDTLIENTETPTAAVSKDSYENAETTLKSALAALDSAKAALDGAEGALNSAVASRDAAKAQLDLANIDNNYTVVTSDISGRVGRFNFSLGNYVTPTSGALITVTQMSPIYARFSMSEQDFAEIFGSVDNLQDDSVQLSLSLLNNDPGDTSEMKSYPIKKDENGKNLLILDNSVHTNMGAVYLWATFENPDDTFNPGGLCRVTVTKVGREKCAIIRNSAIRHEAAAAANSTSASIPYVYVVDRANGNLVERRYVKLGPSDTHNQTILPDADPKKTVKAGEVVVTSGAHKIVMRPNVPTKVMLAPPTGMSPEEMKNNVVDLPPAQAAAPAKAGAPAGTPADAQKSETTAAEKTDAAGDILETLPSETGKD